MCGEADAQGRCRGIESRTVISFMSSTLALSICLTATLSPFLRGTPLFSGPWQQSARGRRQTATRGVARRRRGGRALEGWEGCEGCEAAGHQMRIRRAASGVGPYVARLVCGKLDDGKVARAQLALLDVIVLVDLGLFEETVATRGTVAAINRRWWRSAHRPRAGGDRGEGRALEPSGARCGVG